MPSSAISKKYKTPTVMTAIASAAASSPAPISAPVAARIHTTLAVVTPMIVSPRDMITPAPRKPIPVTSWPTSREAAPSSLWSAMTAPNRTKIVVPRQIRTQVRIPVGLPRSSRSRPTMQPHKKETAIAYQKCEDNIITAALPASGGHADQTLLLAAVRVQVLLAGFFQLAKVRPDLLIPEDPRHKFGVRAENDGARDGFRLEDRGQPRVPVGIQVDGHKVGGNVGGQARIRQRLRVQLTAIVAPFGTEDDQHGLPSGGGKLVCLVKIVEPGDALSRRVARRVARHGPRVAPRVAGGRQDEGHENHLKQDAQPVADASHQDPLLGEKVRSSDCGPLCAHAPASLTIGRAPGPAVVDFPV